jgi:hypothetical protein
MGEGLIEDIETWRSFCPTSAIQKIKSDSCRQDVICKYNRFLDVPDMLEQNAPVLSQSVYR